MRPRERLRVALFTYGVQPRGGVVHALSVAEALAGLGHDAVLFALDETGRGLFRPARCRTVLVPTDRARAEAGSQAPAILPFIRRGIAAYLAALGPELRGFDILHAQDGISGNALATLVERGAIDGYVRTVHHLDAFSDPELAALQDRSVRCAERVYAVSAVWQRTIAERFGRRVDVVPNGVDLDRFSPLGAAERGALRERLGFAGGPLFVTIGGVEARKNAVGTLEAFALVRTALPTARLVIAGGASVFDHGTYRRAFDARAAERGLRLGSDVVVTGPAADEEITALLRAADALVFPSLMEGFGLVALEALACGTPAVVSDREPFTEHLGPGDALFVDPDDPRSIAAGMLRALDPVVAAALRIRGLALVATRTWAGSAAVHADRYRDLLVAKEVARARDAVRGPVAR
jgi:glycosyltransferase-like protein